MLPESKPPADEAATAWLAARDAAGRRGQPPPAAMPRDDQATVPAPDPEQTPPGDAAALLEPPAGERPGRLGRFRLLRELGRGGCGVVFLALDPVLGRQLALKVPHPGAVFQTELCGRFLREAQAAAGLDHPGVVPVYEAGTVGAVGYIGSAYCEGPTLAAWLKGRAEPVPVRAAAALVAQLAEAVHYTHGRGVLHRDLKPSNVILVPVPPGAAGPAAELGFVPRVTDFGLAKLLADPDGQTRTGAVLGTPRYMAPEQAEGRLEDVGPATDIYALGAILYECLTGRPAAPGKSEADILRRVAAEEPAPVSRLRPHVHRDLETICLKCLHKEAGRRYATAGELAEDLHRFLRGEAIRARPPGRAERLRRWGRRRPAVVALASASAVALLVLAAVGAGYEVRLAGVRRAQQDATQEATAARQLAEARHYYELLNRARERSANPQPGWTWAGLADLEQAARLTTPVRDPAELRGEAAACLAGIDLRPGPVLTRDFTASAVAFSPDGAWLAAGQFKAPAFFAPCPVRLLPLAPGQSPRTLAFVPAVVCDQGKLVQDGVRCLAFSPDGRRLAAGARSGWVHLWDLSQPDPRPVCWQAHTRPVRRLAFSPDGTALTSGGEDGTLKRWDVVAGQKELARSSEPALRGRLALHPAGKLLAASCEQGVALLDAESLRACRPLVSLAAGILDFSPDGRLLAVEGERQIRLLNAETGETVRALRAPGGETAHDAAIDALTFNGDGSLLASLSFGDTDRALKLWEVAGGRLAATLPLPGTGVVAVAFHPDGRSLAVAADGQVRLYDLGGLREQTFVASHPFPVRAVALARDGRSLACVSEELDEKGQARGEMTRWETATGRLLDRNPYAVPADSLALPTLAFAGGDLVAYTPSARGIRLWDAGQGREVAVLEAPAARALGLSPRGPTLWAAVAGAEVRSWSLPEGRPAARWVNAGSDLLTGLGGITAVAAGERWLLAGGRDGALRLLRTEDGVAERVIAGPGCGVRSVALSLDERLAAFGTQAGGVRVVAVPGGELLADLSAHRDSVEAVAFGGDGTLLATASRDRTVRLWRRDGQSFRPLLALRAPGPVAAVCLGADGNALAVLVQNETAVRLWHLDRLWSHLSAMGLGEDVP